RDPPHDGFAQYRPRMHARSAAALEMRISVRILKGVGAFLLACAFPHRSDRVGTARGERAFAHPTISALSPDRARQPWDHRAVAAGCPPPAGGTGRAIAFPPT